MTLALITGCSSGIGLAITQTLLAQGWSVTGISRTAPSFDHPAADLSDTSSTDRAFGSVGPVMAAVHAAGLLRVGPHDTMDLSDGMRMWQLHVDTAARTIQTLAPQMQDGGRIVLIGSRVAAGAANRSLYATSKAALIGLSRSIAAELAPRRITVNVVAPAATDTPMLRDPARSNVPPKLPPMGRLISLPKWPHLSPFCCHHPPQASPANTLWSARVLHCNLRQRVRIIECCPRN